MHTFYQKHKNLVRALSFCLILVLILELLSYVSLILNRDTDPMLNSDPHAIFAEKQDTIDVLAFGNSNVRSGIFPLQWYQDYGFTGFSWGEASQRVYDSRLFLEDIFKKQSPSVVLLEASCFFRDDTLADQLDNMAKAYIGEAFPVISYHKNFKKLFSGDFSKLTASARSICKGYSLNYTVKGSKKGKSYMKEDLHEINQNTENLDPLVKREVLKIRDLCEKNGAKMVVMAVPSTSDWNYRRHELTEEFCKEENLTFLDMNTSDIRKEIHLNWKKHTRDGGIHLNYPGAKITTAYLGKYLAENFDLPDHRSDSRYQQWQEDCDYFYTHVDLYHIKKQPKDGRS